MTKKRMGAKRLRAGALPHRRESVLNSRMRDNPVDQTEMFWTNKARNFFRRALGITTGDIIHFNSAKQIADTIRSTSRIFRRPMRGDLDRLALAVSALSIGAFVAWSAQAAPHTPSPLQNQSIVQHVGCTFAGSRCPLGRTWVCAPRGCSCAPCGVYYGAPWRYPVRPWRWRY